jgi:prepilin signal peptidase PulO-like enzyme (type II secretory pathway)
MSTTLALLVGAAFGIAAGSLLVPLTRRELTASLARAAAGQVAGAEVADAPAETPVDVEAPRIGRRQWLVLAAASGVIPAFMLYRVGWSLLALPPLLMLVGLVQLAYCDFTRRLLPKTLVYALGAVVVTSGVAVAAAVPDWEKLEHAPLGGLAFFAVFLFINLMNPRWIAYGDVRLSLVVGFGLAWVSPMALLDGFFYANLMAAVVGLVLIGLHRAKRRSGLPFGLYLAVAAALVLVIWS